MVFGTNILSLFDIAANIWLNGWHIKSGNLIKHKCK